MKQASIKVPPHSEEAEVSVLGSILIDKDAIYSVAPILKPEHFYKDIYGDIYEAALHLYEQQEPIDLVTIADRLKKNKKLKKTGGNSFLASLVEKVPTSAHVEKYARIVKDAATKRELISRASRLVEAAFDEAKSAQEILDQGEQAIFSLSQKHMRQNFVPVKDVLAESFDRLDELQKKAGSLRGVPTGFPSLDDTLAGMQASNLVILAGRPSLGKTSLALNMAQHAAVKEKLPVGFFSLEMSQEELIDRLLVTQGDIDAWRLKTGRLNEADFTRLSDAMGELAEAPLYIDDTPGISVLEMRTKARRLQAEHGLKLIIVDYLQLARSTRRWDSRVQEVSEISQGLKNLARELKVPVLALSQLSRAVEARGTKVPQLADLRECLVGNTLVADVQTGERKSLEQLYKSKERLTLLAMDKKGKLQKTKAEKVTKSGLKKVFQLTTRSGKKVTGSSNHPFYTLNGWQELKKLKAGDLIAVPHSLPLNPQKKGLSKERARLLGYLVSDGSYKKHRCCGFTNKDQKIINDVKKIVRQEFDVQCREDNHNNASNLEFVKVFENNYGRPGGNPLINWLKELGIHGQATQEKRVPEAVFKSNNQVMAEFLKGLFTGDGTIVHRASGRWEVKYSAKNRDLIDDVYHLLLRLGINCSIRQGRKGRFLIHSLEIGDRDNILGFCQKIGFVGQKQKKAELCQKELSQRGTNPKNNLYPVSLTTKIALKAKEQGFSWAKLDYRCQNKRLSRNWLKKVAEKLNDQELIQLAEADFHWEKIKTIKPAGKEMTYDISVPKYHNFIANDIIVHNSGALEQDADVVMFLYREEDDDLEKVNLKVAKHRNGPLRTIELFFKGDRISFYETDTKREE